MKKLYKKEITSLVGKLTLVSSNEALVAVLWENEIPGRVKLGKLEISNEHPILLDTEKQLKEYFLGKRKVFDLSLNPIGTPFQSKVWKALQEIPFGKVCSYSELAKTIGSPKASRAVGAANGRNPISIIIPCHRVIGKSGKLIGFAGGLPVKETLLKLEKFSSNSAPQ